MLFRILGPVAACGAGGEVPLGGPRHRVLLATLLTRPGRVVPADRLLEALWGELPPRRAVEMLHVRISELRKLLRAGTDNESDLIVTRRPGYLLDIAADQVDAHRFERAAATARQTLTAGHAAAAAQQLGAALGLWRGPVLADLADRAFAQPEITRLENLHAQAIEDRIGADLAAGRHHEVIAELEGLVHAQPLHERHRAQLMLALYREGRQSDALEAYRQAAERLRDELGLDPGAELQQLRLSILRQDEGLVPPVVPSPHHGSPTPDLPVPLTSFVGRESELADVGKQLADARLVTLTGPGGVGKSRLAIETARTPGEAFPDGAWLVELAGVREPALIASTVAAALGVRDQPHQPPPEAIADRLRSTTGLLILDNCEHLLGGVADLVRHLLRGCPALRILCTSRERLGLTGELVSPLAGLPVPAADQHTAADVSASSAVRLFVDRAAAAQPRFQLTDDSAAAVAEITRRLDGLPLAIELAAARSATFGPGQIVARLEDRFRLLSRGGRDALPRHQTLRAVVAWSYGLLTEPEQRFFNQLAVFHGGFTVEAAEAVCADTTTPTTAGTTAEDPADLLGRLVDKSLVVTDAAESSEYRYRMLETLRAYGLEELTRRGEADQLRTAHASYYLKLATAAGAGLRGPDHALWHARLHTEYANLRAAMDWALHTYNDETAAGIAAPLYRYWDLHGQCHEGRDWLRRVLADERQLSPTLRARALMGAATLALMQGDLDEATNAYRFAAQLGRGSGDAAVLAHALQYLGYIALLARRHEEAHRLLDEAQHAAARGDAPWEHAWTLLFQALLALFEDRLDDAIELADGTERMNDTVGDQELRSWVSFMRGGVALKREDVRDAARHVSVGVEGLRRLGGRPGMTPAPPLPRPCHGALLYSGIIIAGASNREAAAVRLLGAAECLRESAGIGLWPRTEAILEDTLAPLRARLAPDQFAHEWHSGQKMTIDDAMSMALVELKSCQ